jgi:hypothetical protein
MNSKLLRVHPAVVSLRSSRFWAPSFRVNIRLNASQSKVVKSAAGSRTTTTTVCKVVKTSGTAINLELDGKKDKLARRCKTKYSGRKIKLSQRNEHCLDAMKTPPAQTTPPAQRQLPRRNDNVPGAKTTPSTQRKLYRKSERYLLHLLIGVASTSRWAMELCPAVSDVAKKEVFIACFATVNSPYFGFNSSDIFAQLLSKRLRVLSNT